MGFEIRVPRAMMPGRLWPAGARLLRDPERTAGERGGTDRRHPPPPRDEDVELAVRERLYGTRTHAR
jgi:hypothetical protein